MDSVVEPLRAASNEEIEQLIEIYEKQIPKSVQFVSLLQNILRINNSLHGREREKASPRFRKTIYIPNDGNLLQTATFVVINPEEDIYYMINTLENPPVELTNVLQTTNLVKWHHRPLFVIGGDNGIQECLHQLVTERNLQSEILSNCINYWMPRDKAINLSYSVPDGVELKELRVEDAKQMNEWWPLRYNTSQWYFESAIQHNGGLGLFDKKDGQLVACVFKNDHDGIGHLYTIPERNNRGYGGTLARAITKRIAINDNQHVHTFIDRTNERSVRLFEKIGYVAVNRTEWHNIVKPRSESDG
ncbi:uncharacterized protein LOC128723184 [Anopheles nili]|uniref:uncharacterized protein LOC128723184 n=1 Tax=Anopheles nili TaxID=185578 RepID=UPI00237A6884|nr:uncharacterized protein LOC128723184 [Anopheles nili]